MIRRSSGQDSGNCKIMDFHGRRVIRIYPYIISPKKETSDTEKNLISLHNKVNRVIYNETDDHKKSINNMNRLYKLMGYGYCNEWNYFLTVTLDKRKIDRFDVDLIVKSVSARFKSIKQYHDPEFRYCYIIEKHKNGAYHLHGLLNISNPDIIDFNYRYEYEKGKFVYPSDKSKFVQYGIKQDIFNLGLIVISPINSRDDVVNYVSKYISKNIALRSKHKQCIFVSKGMKQYDQYLFYYQPETNCIFTSDNHLIFDLNCLEGSGCDFQIGDIKYYDFNDSILQ